MFFDSFVRNFVVYVAKVFLSIEFEVRQALCTLTMIFPILISRATYENGVYAALCDSSFFSIE